MCHYPTTAPAKAPVYNNTSYQRYNPPLNTAPVYSRNHAVNGANTYWKLTFLNENGVQQNLIMLYNNTHGDFLQCIKDTVINYHIDVESATLLVPGPRPAHTPSHMLITNQRHFTRALSLLPSNEDMYNAMRGFPVRVNQKVYDHKKEDNELNGASKSAMEHHR